MPGGRLGINSRICDALWSAHQRGKREEAEGKRASGEGTKRSRGGAGFRALKESEIDWTAGHLSNAEQPNSEGFHVLPGKPFSTAHLYIYTHIRESLELVLQSTVSSCSLMSKMLWTQYISWVRWAKVEGTSVEMMKYQIRPTGLQQRPEAEDETVTTGSRHTEKRQETEVLLWQTWCDKRTRWFKDKLQFKYRF